MPQPTEPPPALLPSTPSCLDPAVHVLWRDDRTVQIGLDPAHRVLVTDASPDVVRAVRALTLDDPATAHDGASLHARLKTAGLVRCGGPWRDATRTWVQVVATGPTGRVVQAALARTPAARLGRCDVTESAPSPAADLVVVAPDDGRMSEIGEELQARGTPHLWAHHRDGRAVVGPLVTPGRTTCLRCVDLWMTAHDPGWPRLLAQWEQGRGRAVPGGTPDSAPQSAPADLLAGLVVGQVVRWITGEHRACWGSTLEEQPDGTVERRTWPLHPDCGCAWQTPRCPAADAPG